MKEKIEIQTTRRFYIIEGKPVETVASYLRKELTIPDNTDIEVSLRIHEGKPVVTFIKHEDREAWIRK